MWFFLTRGKSGKFASGQEKAVNVKVCEKSAASLFSSKKFSENAVKIILKKSKTKSRVILIFFFWGGGIFLEVSAAELITLVNVIMNLNKQTKPQEKKLFKEQNKANKVLTESLYFKLFLHINLKRRYDIIACNKML